MMHREVVARKKAPIIAISLIILTIMLYVQQILSFMSIRSKMSLNICNLVMMIIMLGIVIKEIFICNTSYKYSVIADKLIINKTIFNKEKNILSIHLKDIVYFGKKTDEFRDIKKISRGNLSCTSIGFLGYQCIYKKNDEYYKFNFKPSEELARRLSSKIA